MNSDNFPIWIITVVGRLRCRLPFRSVPNGININNGMHVTTNRRKNILILQKQRPLHLIRRLHDIRCSCWLLPCNLLVLGCCGRLARMRWRKSLLNFYARSRRDQLTIIVCCLFALFLQTMRPKPTRCRTHIVSFATRWAIVSFAQLGAATIGHVRILRGLGKRCYP